MNNTPVTQPEFGIYQISREFIEHLRKTDPRIADPNETTTYCGPVYRKETKRGPLDYFVPVDVKTFEETEYFLMNFRDGILADVLDFNIMIPCLPADYKFDDSNAKLSEFWISAELLVRDCAEYMMKKHHEQQNET